MNKSIDRMRLVIVDDKKMRQAGIASLISDWAALQGLDIVQINATTIIKEFERNTTCRLVLFSVGSESVGSGEAGGILRVLRALVPHAQAIVISDSDDPAEVLCAYRAGCRGYIPTSMEPSVALQAMEFVLKGGSYFPPSALGLVNSRNANGGGEISGASDDQTAREIGNDKSLLMPASRESVHESIEVASCMAQLDRNSAKALTDRQREVLECLQRGQPNKLIARELALTEGTVKVHVRQIMRKLGASNRTQVAVLSASSEEADLRKLPRRLGIQ